MITSSSFDDIITTISLHDDNYNDDSDKENIDPIKQKKRTHHRKTAACHPAGRDSKDEDDDEGAVKQPFGHIKKQNQLNKKSDDYSNNTNYYQDDLVEMKCNSNKNHLDQVNKRGGNSGNNNKKGYRNSNKKKNVGLLSSKSGNNVMANPKVIKMNAANNNNNNNNNNKKTMSELDQVDKVLQRLSL
jgi:hypothetical protein